MSGQCQCQVSLIFESGSLIKPGALQFGQTVWSASLRDLPVSALLAPTPVLELQACTTAPCHLHRFWGFKLRSSYSRSKRFTNGVASPTLQTQLFKKLDLVLKAVIWRYRRNEIGKKTRQYKGGNYNKMGPRLKGEEHTVPTLGLGA